MGNQNAKELKGTYLEIGRKRQVEQARRDSLAESIPSLRAEMENAERLVVEAKQNTEAAADQYVLGEIDKGSLDQRQKQRDELVSQEGCKRELYDAAERMLPRLDETIEKLSTALSVAQRRYFKAEFSERIAEIRLVLAPDVLDLLALGQLCNYSDLRIVESPGVEMVRVRAFELRDELFADV